MMCPMHLSPFKFHENFDLGKYEENEKIGIFNCIECGVCSFVCLGKVDLLGEIRKEKQLSSGKADIYACFDAAAAADESEDGENEVITNDVLHETNAETAEQGENDDIAAPDTAITASEETEDVFGSADDEAADDKDEEDADITESEAESEDTADDAVSEEETGTPEETNEAEALVEAPQKVALRRYNNFQASLLIDGEAEQVATEVSADIDFGIDTEGYAIGGNGYRVRANEGIIRPSGNVTVFFDDATYLQRAENSTKTSLEVDLDANGNKLQLMLPEVKFARSSPTIEGATGITQQLDYSAFYENNEQDACVVFILTNDVASYEFVG